VALTRLAWGICFLALAIATSDAVLAVVNRGSIDSAYDANAIEIVAPIGWAILGGLIAARQPGNAMGWLLLSVGSAGDSAAVLPQPPVRGCVLT
jgi:hypothetical protein